MTLAEMSDTEYRAEMLGVVAMGINNHPRSQQRRIGPSGVGTPCPRKLGHRLAQTDDAADRSPAWRPTVGTAVHTWLTSTFENDNINNYSSDRPRWMTDLKVIVGSIDGEIIDGHLDLYDRFSATVVDWKIPGPTSIRDKRKNGPGAEYRIQTHLYGRGIVAMGLECRRVGILFMPSNGELSESYYWSEPYDEQIALDALARADGIAAALRLLGPDVVLPQLATAEDHCTWCAWFVPATTDLVGACPGDPSLLPRAGDTFNDLLITH